MHNYCSCHNIHVNFVYKSCGVYTICQKFFQLETDYVCMQPVLLASHMFCLCSKMVVKCRKITFIVGRAHSLKCGLLMLHQNKVLTIV